MCGGVLYHYQDKDVITYFPNPKAQLPVKKHTGEILLLPWGRRKQQSGVLPLGGWARQESLVAGHWHKYHPRSVKLPILKFMEKDKERVSHWFELIPGQYIHGIIAQQDEEQRVYVVTVTPQMPNAIHDRWPKIITDTD